MRIKERRTMTKEERRVLSDKILIALLDGDEESEIMRRCHCTLGNAKVIANELVESGAVKKEDIIKAREEKRKNNRRTGIPLSQEYRVLCKQSILDRIKSNDMSPFSQLARDLNTSAPTVKKIINELIAEGETTEIEVDKAMEIGRKKAKIRSKKNDGIVLDELVKGSKEETISELTGMPLAAVVKRMNSWVEQEIIRIEDIKQAREMRKAKEIEYNKKMKRIRTRIESMTSSNRTLDVEEVIRYVSAVKEHFLESHEGLEKDMDILRRAIPMNEILMTNGNVNLVVTYFTRKKKPEICMNFIDECIEATSDKSVDLMR